MSENIPDLWAADLGASIPRSPVAIIRAQATNLSQRTKGLVAGNVRPYHIEEAEEEEGTLPHVFELRVPALGRYSMPLFYFTTKMNALYPVQIIPEWIKDSAARRMRIVAEDEQSLFDGLRKVLNDKSTLNTIGALMAHAGAEATAKPEPESDDVPF